MLSPTPPTLPRNRIQNEEITYSTTFPFPASPRSHGVAFFSSSPPLANLSDGFEGEKKRGREEGRKEKICLPCFSTNSVIAIVALIPHRNKIHGVFPFHNALQTPGRRRKLTTNPPKSSPSPIRWPWRPEPKSRRNKKKGGGRNKGLPPIDLFLAHSHIALFVTRTQALSLSLFIFRAFILFFFTLSQKTFKFPRIS